MNNFGAVNSSDAGVYMFESESSSQLVDLHTLRGYIYL